MKDNRVNQPATKKVVQISNGVIVRVWDSIRFMCDSKKFDRRAVQRCLNKEESFKTVKGFQFEFPEDHIPIEEYKTGRRFNAVIKRHK